MDFGSEQVGRETGFFVFGSKASEHSSLEIIRSAIGVGWMH
jgi:hypothetical protein